MKKKHVFVKIGGEWKKFFQAGKAWKVIIKLFWGSTPQNTTNEFEDFVGERTVEDEVPLGVEKEIKELLYSSPSDGGSDLLRRMSTASDSSIALKRWANNPGNLSYFNLLTMEVGMFEKHRCR